MKAPRASHGDGALSLGERAKNEEHKVMWGVNDVRLSGRASVTEGAASVDRCDPLCTRNIA